MPDTIESSRLGTSSKVLTEVELNALQEEFRVSKSRYDTHDVVLADISAEMLKALQQADSITITTKQGQQEIHLPLRLAFDGYLNLQDQH